MNFFNDELLAKMITTPEQIAEAKKHGEKVVTTDNGYELTAYVLNGHTYITDFHELSEQQIMKHELDKFHNPKKTIVITTPQGRDVKQPWLRDEMDEFENVEGEGDISVNLLPPRDNTFEPLTISINSEGGHVGCCAEIINSVAGVSPPNIRKLISQMAEAERAYVHLGRAGRAASKAIQEFNIAVSATDFSNAMIELTPLTPIENFTESTHSLKRPDGWYHKFNKPNGKRNKNQMITGRSS